MYIHHDEKQILLVLSTIVGALIIIANGSLSDISIFTTIMMIYIYIFDITFIYQRFGHSYCNIEDRLTEYSLWILCGEIGFAVFIYTTKLFTTKYSLNNYLAHILAFLGVFVVYETIKVFIVIRSQFSKSARRCLSSMKAYSNQNFNVISQ